MSLLFLPTFYLISEISPKGKKKLDYKGKTKSSHKLPLIGKTIYLDIKDAKQLKQLQTNLKSLGAVSL